MNKGLKELKDMFKFGKFVILVLAFMACMMTGWPVVLFACYGSFLAVQPNGIELFHKHMEALGDWIFKFVND